MKMKSVKSLPKYVPPYSLREILDNIGYETYAKLSRDPCHRWRALTGLELIHREPTVGELRRIWQNWQLMSPFQKCLSDIKSVSLFGVTNEVHYHQLMGE